jgi:beta-glucosidase/6-phospho-beta-glucosidase/beta-galactosidase
MTEHVRVFSSFWMAGFESACHITRQGIRLDMIHATQHDHFIEQDYANLANVGISSVRDTVRWHLVESNAGRFDFSSMNPVLEAAARHGIQVVWNLCHYGWPKTIDLMDPAFIERFARFAGAVSEHVRDHSSAVPLYTPINEISFFAWAAGEVGWFYPYGKGRGGELKRQLIRACIAGINAIWDVDPRARIVIVEPLIHVVAPVGEPQFAAEAAAYRNSQFEACDMLSGALCPELGGQPRYLDVVGVNFYHDNQWEHPGGRKLAWHVHPRDRRWMPFHTLLHEVYDRYRRPLFVGETSHVGSGRAAWIRELTDEIVIAIEAGVPLEGVCLYPIIDRFEWENPSHWHNSGLWDVAPDSKGRLHRVLNRTYAAELRRSQARVDPTRVRSIGAIGRTRSTPPESRS